MNDIVFSPRELEFLRLAATGLSNQQIAEKIHKSLGTVGQCRVAITEKTGCTNSIQLGAWAERNGLLAGVNVGG